MEHNKMMKKVFFLLFFLSIQFAVICQNMSDSVVVEKTHKTMLNQDSAVVDVVPEFPGGDKKRMKFIKKNLKYPLSAKVEKIQGTVYIQFIIEPDGSITNVRIKKDIGHGCGEEAARIVKLMPKWKPAMQGGKPVRTEFNLPVRFMLS